MATTATSRIDNSKVTTHGQWLTARKELLKKEKELTRLHDEVSKVRRELPWELVDKQYVFEGPEGKESLADLFAGRSQLIVYHFMMGPDWAEGCKSCSLLAESIDGNLAHLNARDVTLVVVSRAPYSQIAAFQKRMGWKFKWVSSNGTDFNFDYGVSFKKEDRVKGEISYNYVMQNFPQDEAPGASVFYNDEAGEVFHTYSTYGRGLEQVMGVYQYLDLAPKGRDEEGLAFSMEWVKHHDKYENKPVNAGATSMQAQKSGDSCCSH